MKNISRTIKKIIDKIPVRAWILLALILVGIFLRTYHFHDWLLFNPDQARDATVVQEMVMGKTSWLVLGPEAGNTRFQLGPWFYHMEAISAKIFGATPDAMAYPDLLFSILSIPLFYIFVKKYFKTELSLALTALYSFSYFSVRYSRFAWNPNSIPFFLLIFLLGILYLMETDRRKSFWGSIMVGVGIGVGIQLHIILFFIMPFVAGLFFLFLLLKKGPVLPVFGRIGIVIILILLANLGQVLYEAKYGLHNTRRFIKSSSDTTVEIKPRESLRKDFLCFARANLHMISSLGDGEECDSQKILDTYYADKRVFLISSANKLSLELIAIGSTFTVAGFLLAAFFWKKETDKRRRNFLALTSIYGLTTFAVMFPVIDQTEPRYFAVSFFVPLVFFGLIADGLMRFKSLATKIFVAVIFVWLLYLNGTTEAKAVQTFFSNRANDENYAYLGETESMANYMIANSHNSKTIHLRGARVYEKRFFKPLNFILEKSGYDLVKSKNKEELTRDAPVFFIEESRFDKYRVGNKIGKNARVDQVQRFGKVSLIIPREDKNE